jgi:hypothetical protein
VPEEKDALTSDATDCSVITGKLLIFPPLTLLLKASLFLRQAYHYFYRKLLFPYGKARPVKPAIIQSLKESLNSDSLTSVGLFQP